MKAMCVLMVAGVAFGSVAAAQDTIVDTMGFEGFAVDATINGQMGWTGTAAATGVPGAVIVDGDAMGIGGGQVLKLEVADVQNSSDPPTREAFWGTASSSRPAGSLAEASILFPDDLYSGSTFYDWAIVEFDVYKPYDGWDSNLWMFQLNSLLRPGGFDPFRGQEAFGFTLFYDQFQGDSKESTNPGVGDDLFNINGQWTRGDVPNDNNHPGQSMLAATVGGAWPQWWEIIHDDWFTVQMVFLFDYDNDGDLDPTREIQHDLFVDHPTVSPIRGIDGNVDGPYSYFNQAGLIDSLPSGSTWDPNETGIGADFGWSGWSFQLSKDDATPEQPDTWYIDNFRVIAGTGLPAVGDTLAEDGFEICTGDLDSDSTPDADDHDLIIFGINNGRWAYDLNVDLNLDFFDYATWGNFAAIGCP